MEWCGGHAPWCPHKGKANEAFAFARGKYTWALLLPCGKVGSENKHFTYPCTV